MDDWLNLIFNICFLMGIEEVH